MVRSRSGRIARAVAACCVLAIFMFPIYYWITVAFKYKKDIFAIPPKLVNFDVTIRWFREVFGVSFGMDPTTEVLRGGGNFYAMPHLVDSIIVAIGSTALTVVIATLAAYALSRMRIPGRHHFIFAVLSTRMLPPIAVAIPMFFVYQTFNLLDTHIGLIIIHALMNLPLAVLLLKSFFDDVPMDIDEAALIDGASHLLIFRKMVLPLALGGIAATAVLCFIFSWTEFLYALTLTQTSLKTVPVISSSFVTSTGTAWGNMAALGVAAMVPAFIFILLTQRHLVRGLTLGSVKR